MTPTRPYLILAALCASVLLLAGCSTKKKGILNRAYHNVTSHYNGYWNGRESLKEGVAALGVANKDDFTRIIPVFPAGGEEESRAVYPQMDRALQKGAFVIDRHSMLIKGREYCNWIDDSYMLIGQANYYKRDYLPAIEVFNYVVKQYATKPIRIDGYLWLVRTYSRSARFKDAELIITALEAEEKFPKKKKGEYGAVMADHWIEKQDYPKALEEIRKAIAYTKARRKKTRYTFIEAQLHEEMNNRDSAAYFYTQVLRRSTPYDMEFNARINRALMTNSTSGELASIKKELEKMAKDEKNVDFLDRIYFALGKIAYEEKDQPVAMDYFKKSIAANTGNTAQKAESYFTIADILFDIPEYEESGLYYDSSLAVISERHEKYDHVKTRKESLAELIKNVNIIRTQDSLLRIAAMSPNEIDRFIADVIRKEFDRQEAARQAEADRQAAMAAGNQPAAQTPSGSAAGSWYFYNPTALSFGVSDFLRKWGDRKLEDNWRRSNKRSLEMSTTADADTASNKDSVLLDPEFYRKGLPLTEAQRDSSLRLVQNAYYDLGGIYKDQLSDIDRSIKTYEDLLQKYPKGIWTLESLYQLHRLYTQKNDMANAERCKQRIVREFPESDYAKILTDPNHLKKMEAMRNRLSGMYERAMTSYREDRFEDALATIDSVVGKVDKHKLIPKFALLKAMCIGRTQRLDVYKAALDEFIKKYPKDEEKAMAVELLAYVNDLTGEKMPDEVLPAEPLILYRHNADTVQYFMVVVNRPGFRPADMKARLSDFNAVNYSNETLMVKDMKMGRDKDLVFVQGFSTPAKARDYYELIKADSTVFNGLNETDAFRFLIAVGNFAKFYQRQDVPEYMRFFRKNYLGLEGD